MSFSPQFRRKLQESLGADGAEEFVSSMDRLDASRGDIAELKQELLAVELRLNERLTMELKEFRAAMGGEIKEFRAAIAAEFNGLREGNGRDVRGLRDEIKDLRESTGQDVRGLRDEIKELREGTGKEIKDLRESTGNEFKGVRAAISSLDNKIEEKHAALLTWSFLFWVGAVAAIAVLAGVLRS